MARIMVIDEDRAFLDLMMALLDDQEREIETADERFVTVEQIREVSPDLVVLDLRGHDMASRNLLLALKDDASTESIPVIACTAVPSEMTDLDAWLRRHGVTVLPKPFDIDAMASLATQMLDRKCA
jgi:DNA-binding response OmpR family regulator